MREPPLVAAILSEVVLGAVRDVLMIGALGAGMEDRHDDIGSRRGLPHESLRRVKIEQALRPRIRGEAEDRHAHAVSAEDGDLVGPATPAQAVVGECSQGLLLAGRAVVEGVVVRDIEVVEPCAAQQGGRSRGSLEGVAARASRVALRASSGARASLRGCRSRRRLDGADRARVRTASWAATPAVRCRLRTRR